MNWPKQSCNIQWQDCCSRASKRLPVFPSLVHRLLIYPSTKRIIVQSNYVTAARIWVLHSKAAISSFYDQCWNGRPSMSTAAHHATGPSKVYRLLSLIRCDATNMPPMTPHHKKAKSYFWLVTSKLLQKITTNAVQSMTTLQMIACSSMRNTKVELRFEEPRELSVA